MQQLQWQPELEELELKQQLELVQLKVQLQLVQQQPVLVHLRAIMLLAMEKLKQAMVQLKLTQVSSLLEPIVIHQVPQLAITFKPVAFDPMEPAITMVEASIAVEESSQNQVGLELPKRIRVVFTLSIFTLDQISAASQEPNQLGPSILDPLIVPYC